jgi:hypothetical protein
MQVFLGTSADGKGDKLRYSAAHAAAFASLGRDLPDDPGEG